MKVRQITERHQINELAPLVLPVIGAVTVSGIVTFLFNAISAYWMYDDAKEYIEKYGADPTKWPEDVIWLFLGTMLGAYLGGKLLNKAAASGWNGIESFKKLWNGVPKSVQDEVIQKVAPAIKEKVSKQAAKNHPGTAKIDPSVKSTSTPSSTPTAKTAPKDPNKVEKPFSTAPDATSPANAPAKNPNLIDRPFKKEDILRLAGLVK
jgi:hypothetical protein